MADGSLIFDTRVDTSGFSKSSKNVRDEAKRIADSMKDAGKQIEETINRDISDSVDNVGRTAQETSSKIQAILDDTERSAKSKAAGIAAIYKAQGLNASDAMKKAWEHIERGSSEGSERIKEDAKDSAKKVESYYRNMGSNVGKIFRKFATLIATTFSVAAIVRFGKESINLASDVQEVQNVVDTAFGSMKYKMEEFADTCIETYGMSKLTAKQMGSTFMAMAKGIGQATDVASDKAVELTGRLGDIMSFYNKSATEVNTIGKAIYSGETEPLKAIGIIMTENNLKTYALAKGYKKLYTEMSAAEKLLVRQEYFLEKTSMAAGDFVKTQDSWANQTRILSERWKEFMTICGNGLIQVLTPVVKALNNMLDSLIGIGEQLSEVFGISVASNVSEEAAAAREEIAGMGESIEETIKQAEGGTASFDDLEIIGGTKDASGEIGGGSVAADRVEETVATKESEKATGALEQAFKRLGETIGWLGDVFKTSFIGTFGDTGVFRDIIQSVKGIKDSMVDMITAPEIQEAAAGFVEAYVSQLGSSAGALASIGSSIASNIVGGIQMSLADNGDRIKESMVTMFNIGEEMSEIQEEFWGAIAGIFTAFRSDDAKEVTSSIITLFTNAVLGITELLGKFAVDVIDLITAPFVENEELIRTTIENTFAAVGPALGNIQTVVDEVFGTISEVYDTKISPMLTEFKDGFVELSETLLNAYNEYILPVVELCSERFDEFTNGPLHTLIVKFGEFAGKVAECITAIWQNVLQPFIQWFTDNIVPVIQPALTAVADVFFTLWDGIASVVGFILDALGGLLDFIGGIFTGDWERVWNGIKDFFLGIWNVIVTGLKTVVDAIYGLISGLVNVIKKCWEKAWASAKNTLETAWSALKIIIVAIKVKFETVFTSIKDTVTGIFTGLWDSIKKVINSILGGIEGMANGVVKGINAVIGAMNNLSFDIPDWIPGMGGKTFGFNISMMKEVKLPRLATGTVVPANFGEFAAILGDNKREAEVVSPVSTMKQAFKEALSEMGGMGGGVYEFVAVLDGREIFRETVRQDKMHVKRTGMSAFAT